MSSTFEQLRTILVDDYGVAPEVVTPEATWETLGLDSLAIVEMMWTAEDRFKIKLPAEQADLPTVAAVVSCIDGLIASGGSADRADGVGPAASDGPAT